MKAPGILRRVLSAIAALLCSWAGLGMLGVVSGWQNIDTWTAKILGVFLLFLALRFAGALMAPGISQSDGQTPESDDKPAE